MLCAFVFPKLETSYSGRSISTYSYYCFFSPIKSTCVYICYIFWSTHFRAIDNNSLRQNI